jgi:hypothetical protein
MFEYKDKFYPGIFINNESVGGKTYSEVLNKYKTNADIIKEKGISIVFLSAWRIPKRGLKLTCVFFFDLNF